MYAVKKITNSDFQVTNLQDDPITYNVTKNNRGHYSCDCRGFYVQKDKTQHKHCLMVKALEEMEDYDSFVIDKDWKVVDAFSYKEMLDQFETFMDEVIEK
jgi:hypothetical protein